MVDYAGYVVVAQLKKVQGAFFRRPTKLLVIRFASGVLARPFVKDAAPTAWTDTKDLVAGDVGSPPRIARFNGGLPGGDRRW
jgi:hypothetical protein